MTRVIVCTVDSGHYEFAKNASEIRGWAQRGPINIPQELLDRYKAALKAHWDAGMAIEDLLEAAGMDD